MNSRTPYPLSRTVSTLAMVAILALSSTTMLRSQRVTRRANSKELNDVGMVALLATPHTYQARRIRVIGFLGIEVENDALYLHGDDYRYGLTKNSLALRLSAGEREKCKRLGSHYVIIEATMYADGPEASGMWSGALGDVTRVELWPADREANPHR